MRITLGQMLNSRLPSKLGWCRDDPRIVAYLNDGQSRLLELPGEWHGRLQLTELWLGGKSFFLLPPGAIAVSAAWVPNCCAGVNLGNQWFRFVGACNRVPRGDACLDVEHAGRSSMAQIPECPPFRVFAIARYKEDLGLQLWVEGLDENGNVVRSESRAGTRITATSWDANTDIPSTCWLSTMSLVTKGVSHGEIEIYAEDQKGCRLLLSELYPHETGSLRERYDVGCDAESIEAALRLGHVPVVRETDPFVLTSETAISYAAEASKADEERDYGRFQALMNQAKDCLYNQLEAASPGREVTRVTIEPGRRNLNRRVFADFR